MQQNGHIDQALLDSCRKPDGQITVTPQVAETVAPGTLCTLLGLMPEPDKQFIYGMICGMIHSKMRKGA